MLACSKVFTVSFLVLLIAEQFRPVHGQSFCDSSGNVIIYSNYDGGYLNINIDQNIPNLKIGITTYEKSEIEISGTYASNVTQVIYAGYNGNNDHCSPSPPTTSINGVPSSITSIELFPPVTLPNSNGYYYIICNFSCDSSTYQGGCNTPDQIADYYLTQFGGSLYYHYTQYNCWVGTYNVSSGGNCCIGAIITPPDFTINASFSLSEDTVCAKDSVFFMNTTFNNYPGGTFYNWDFGDGSPIDTNANPTHLYAASGTYTVTLIATNSGATASDTVQFILTVINCFTGINEVSESNMSIYPNPADDIICLSSPSFQEIQLFGPVGNLILEGTEIVNGHCLSVKDLQAGIYFLSVKHVGKTHRLKISVQ